jgi:hypothetical protein
MNIRIEGLPDSVQPGAVRLPAIAASRRPPEEFLATPDWDAARAVDGLRCLAFADARIAVLQTGEDALLPPPGPELEARLRKQAGDHGAFALDGFLTYQALDNSTWTTAEEARFANLQIGQERPGQVQFLALQALALGDEDLTALTLERRMARARQIAPFQGPLQPMHCQEGERRERLVERARREGTPGILWLRRDAPYRPGGDDLVFSPLAEQLNVWAVGLTPSSHPALLLAAVEVAEESPEGLRSVAQVQAGLSPDAIHRLSAAIARHGRAAVVVACHGRTPGGRLWQPRFVRLADEADVQCEAP